MVPEISLEELEEPLLTTSSTNDSAIAVESEVRNVFLSISKGSFISFQLVPNKIPPKFLPLCNQKHAQI